LLEDVVGGVGSAAKTDWPIKAQVKKLKRSRRGFIGTSGVDVDWVDRSDSVVILYVAPDGKILDERYLVHLH